MALPVAQAAGNRNNLSLSLATYDRLINEAPYLSRCSDNKTAALVRPREYAVRYPYLQVNRRDMVSWLVFDLDHSNCLIWEDESLPAPNIVVKNPKNGHSHLFYAIAPVCTSESARSGPIRYMKAVYEAMAARLNADPAYSGPVAKTPGHSWWSTWEIHNSEYDLGELADYVDTASTPPWSQGPDIDSVSHSRHCMLFEQLRFYAYSIVYREKEQGTFRSFSRLLDAFAYNKNSFTRLGFSQNLTSAQLQATVKSVARWTWDCYTGGSKCHRGVMCLSNSLSLADRQRLSADRTHQIRKKNTESKIRAACQSIRSQGKELTYIAIAKASGLSRQTVSRYSHIIDERTSRVSKVRSPEDLTNQRGDVSFGVHQIPVVEEEVVAFLDGFTDIFKKHRITSTIPDP